MGQSLLCVYRRYIACRCSHITAYVCAFKPRNEDCFSIPVLRLSLSISFNFALCPLQTYGYRLLVISAILVQDFFYSF